MLGITACATPSSPNDALAQRYDEGLERGGRRGGRHPGRADRWYAQRGGTAGGGYVGYEVGRSIGHGSEGAIAGAVGSVAGAVAGRAVETAATRQSGLQITVHLDGGETVAIVQSADVGFTTGERVKVLRRGNGQARVTKT